MIQPKSNVLDMAVIYSIDAIEDQAWKIYKAALAYNKLGLRILPIVRNGKALPQKRYAISYAHATDRTKVVEKWFHPTEGMFSGWNIGIATGREGGVFVLDVDRHNETDGFRTLDAILEEEGATMPVGPVQNTPGGGKHYVYWWQEDAVSSTNKIGDGIDTRGGVKDACKGHMVVWPSVINGKQYSWETAGPIPVCPKWILERMGVSWSSRPQMGTTGSRGNENVQDIDMEEQVPLEQIERMLNSINPDELGYDEWLQIGMAIRSQHPEEGLGIWDSWSSHGERYETGECNRRWEGFSEIGTIRIATLFHFAKKSGFTPSPTDKKSNPLAMITERYNDHNAIVVVGNKIRVLTEVELTADNKMATPYNLLSRQDFLTLNENDTVLIDPEKGKTMPCSLIWLGDVARKTYPNGMGLFPEGEPEGYYNTWRGFAVDSVPGDCSLFKEHILNVICGSNEKMYNYVLDWCADLFQEPENPKGVALVLRGTEGTGKGTFANTIGMMCAPHYVHLIDENHLTGQFNSHLSDSIVVFADEITWGGNIKSSGKLKGMVTERHMLLERKGIDAVIQRNLNHMLIASNSEWVIPAGVNSRRWLVLDVSPNERSNVNYFRRLHKEIGNGGQEAFLFEMLERKINSNLTEAPVTEALIEQRAMGVFQEDSQLRWWKSVLLNGNLMCDDVMDENNVGWPSSVDKGDIYSRYEDYCLHRKVRVKADNPFFKDLMAYGFAATRLTIRGKRVRMLKVPGKQEAADLMFRMTGIIQEIKDD